MEEAVALWPPLAGWEISLVRTGVRAVPPRTEIGTVPLGGCMGRLDPASGSLASEHGVPVWLAAGLGARGLVYHGLLGAWTAAALVHNKASPPW